MVKVKRYDPGKRQRCVSIYWKTDRHVRILHPAFGYKGKIGAIANVSARYVYVRIKLGKGLGDWTEVAYLPEHLRLI
jgi:hypothetical protein